MQNTPAEIVGILKEEYACEFNQHSTIIDEEIKVINDWEGVNETDLYISINNFMHEITPDSLSSIFEIISTVSKEMTYRDRHPEEGYRRRIKYLRQHREYMVANPDQHTSPHYYMAHLDIVYKEALKVRDFLIKH